MEKRLLDSVHGYINIPQEYIDNIIDSKYFQRLRRIEQTSTRALFPSARHDRFIHSLGVYYIGNLIIEAVDSDLRNGEVQKSKKRKVYESYRISCLLHDIAHAPFSHTFEDYYSNKDSDLRGLLCKLVNNKRFIDDWDGCLDPSQPHERMSAIVAIGEFGNFIEKQGASKELVARMIIGLHYSDKTNHSFENAMISLLHGDLIDADRLDYVCRDVWASGYSTTQIDIDRLVNSIRIKKDDYGIFHLCYTIKGLNEIESVLSVKVFQQRYIFTHHTVTYEQRLLVKAMESVAVFHQEGKIDNFDDEKRKMALEEICNIKCFYDETGRIGISTRHTHRNIVLPMDDDFVSLMKAIPDDKYVKQWLSRKYELTPLWKSRFDFYYRFSNLKDVVLRRNNWIFHEDCKHFISVEFNIPEIDIWIERATPKYRESYTDNIEIFIDNKIVPYKDIVPITSTFFEPLENEFYYIYVPKEYDKGKILERLKEESNKYFNIRE